MATIVNFDKPSETTKENIYHVSFLRHLLGQVLESNNTSLTAAEITGVWTFDDHEFSFILAKVLFFIASTLLIIQYIRATCNGEKRTLLGIESENCWLG